MNIIAGYDMLMVSDSESALQYKVDESLAWN